jgi:hypothetical protein
MRHSTFSLFMGSVSIIYFGLANTAEMGSCFTVVCDMGCVRMEDIIFCI